MRSLPTNISATKCIVLKHKLPTHLRTKCTNTNTNSNLTNTNIGLANTCRAVVDDDLLATVLRVHLETKLRRERARQRHHHTSLKTRVLQRAVNSLDEPMVINALNGAKLHYGFRDALVQLSHLQH